MAPVNPLSRRRFLASSMLAAAVTLPAARAWPAILGPSGSVDRDLDAVTADGKSITLKRAEVQELGESLRGNLLLAGPPGLRPGAPRLERADGQASRAHRSAARRRRRAEAPCSSRARSNLLSR